MLGDEAFQGIEVVLPTLAVDDSPRSISAAARLLLETQRTAHTDNDLTVTDTATDTLFLGDCSSRCMCRRSTARSSAGSR